MEPIKFKFHWVDDDGNQQGFFAKKGEFDGTNLTLDGAETPAATFAQVEVRGNRMILVVNTESREPVYMVFAVTKGSVEALKEAIGRARSAVWAAAHREELVKEGRGHEYRDESCPHCDATLDLTGYARTPQVSCDFCHALGTIEGNDATMDRSSLHKGERRYRLCDECGMYSRPRKFTVFYFYFLLVVYGFSQRETWRCPGCMRPEAWKMFFGNLIFILGVPVAITQLIRAYGGSSIGGLFPGLDGANLNARKGKQRAAIDSYQSILMKRSISAGLKYNIGMAYLHSDDAESATRSLEASLADCSNYEPAASILAACYQQAGETVKLKALKKQWGVEEEEDATS